MDLPSVHTPHLSVGQVFGNYDTDLMFVTDLLPLLLLMLLLLRRERGQETMTACATPHEA